MEAKDFSITPESVYGCCPTPPEGWEFVEFRVPDMGESYYPLSSYYYGPLVIRGKESTLWQPNGPRLILRRKPRQWRRWVLEQKEEGVRKLSVGEVGVHHSANPFFNSYYAYLKAGHDLLDNYIPCTLREETFDPDEER